MQELKYETPSSYLYAKYLSAAFTYGTIINIINRLRPDVFVCASQLI